VKPLPLRTSLTLVYTGILAMLLTALGLLDHSTLVRKLDEDTTLSLEEKARGLHGYLRFRNGMPVLVYDHNDPDSAAFVDDATDYYQVYDARDGRLLTQSPGFEALGLHFTPAEVAEFRDNPKPRDLQTDRGRLRMSSTVIAPSPNEQYVVQVGELLDSVDRTLASFDRLLLWRILGGLALAVLVAPWLAGRALAALSRFAAATRKIDVTNLNARLSVRGTEDELDQVAEAFNHALARVEHSVGEMRQFSAALAHELRTPLAILRGEAELALRPSASPLELRHVLTRQIDEFDRLTRLINQILTLARAEAGQIKIASEPVDLALLGAGVAEQVEPVAAERGIAMRFDIADAALVRGDAGWLERLVLILLDNAIKFTPAGGRITVVCSRRRGMALLSVSDNGVGVSPDAIPHLFERFFRADPARSHQAQGVGLGLALAKWIAERHHANIEVESRPGAGSTFTVVMPAIDSDLEERGAAYAQQNQLVVSH